MRIVIADIEADNLLNDITRIWCIGAIDNETGEEYLFEPNQIQQGIKFLQSYDRIVFHNHRYDAAAIEKLTGVSLWDKCWDTLIMSKLLFPFRNKHSLAYWGERMNFGKDNHTDFSCFSQSMAEYCLQDVRVTRKLFNGLRTKFDMEADWFQLEHDAARLEQKAVNRGVMFDYELAMKTYQEITAEMHAIQQEVSDFLGYKITDKTYRKTKTGKWSHFATKMLATNPEYEYEETDEDVTFKIPVKITLDTKALLIEKLLQIGWVPSMVTEKGNPRIADKGNVCENLLNLSPQVNRVGTYFILKHRQGLINGFFDLVRKDGCIESEADTLGTVTGRFAHRGIANFPSERAAYGNEIRSMFKASDGYKIVGSDLAGIEARLLAHYMNDANYTNEVLNGDIHTANQEAAGLPTRDAAKTFFYGFLYGAGDEKVGQLVNGGREEGAQVKEKFLSNLPTLKTLIETKQKEAEKGYVTALGNRPVKITRSPNWQGVMQYDTRKALNSLLQGSGAVYFKKWACVVDDKIQEEGLDATIIILYHDELQIEVHPSCVDRLKDLLKEAQEETDVYFDVKCPNDIDTKVGNNWHETH
jgi:DNA polymerase-1